MPNGKRSILSMLESYLDMAINALALCVAFIVAHIFGTTPPFSITNPQAIIAIFTIMIISSFMYHVTDNYRPTIYTVPRKSYFNVIKANVMVFALIMIWIVFFGKEGMRTFESFWALIYLVLSSAFLITKRRIMFWVLRFLRAGQYSLKRTLIVGDNTSSAKEYVHEIVSMIYPIGIVILFGFSSAFRMQGFFKTLICGMLLLALQTFSLLFSIIENATSDATAWQPWYVIILGVISVISIGIREECIFRATIQGVLAKKYANSVKGIWLTALLSALIFGLIHSFNIFAGVLTLKPESKLRAFIVF